MRQRPDAANLIDMARRALLEEIAPDLSGRSRYAALMVANVLAIALRDLSTGDADRAAEIALFEDLYGTDAIAAAGDDRAAALLALNRRLAREIRDGRWDAMPAPLRRLLSEQTRLRLARTSPKYMARYDPDR